MERVRTVSEVVEFYILDIVRVDVFVVKIRGDPVLEVCESSLSVYFTPTIIVVLGRVDEAQPRGDGICHKPMKTQITSSYIDKRTMNDDGMHIFFQVITALGRQ